jgi:exopolysaccharide biosynthesis protein
MRPKKGFLIIPIFLLILLASAAIAASYFAGRNSIAKPQVTITDVQINPTEDELSQLTQQTDKSAQNVLGTTSIPTSSILPTNGYVRQKVVTDRGTFTVSIVAANLNSTRVIVDTASDSSCSNDCPVLSLRDYVTRSGAYAGINGGYFCPSSYPSCSGKKNSFDTLLMNKKKVYFNSDNNVYSTVPAVIFSGGSARFVGQSLEWGRDTGPDAVLANYPLLIQDGGIRFTGSGDGKLNGKGNRSFVGSRDNYAYIGIVQNATVADVAVVLKTMGMRNALNLDSGGSTALWSGGYKFGPGRGIPNALLFVRK